MRSSTWTPDALASERRPYKAKVWRVVEAQHVVSTLKVVDTLDEQAILEAEIETVKPPLPDEAAGLHWLLAAPFRHRPYPYGSRFRRAGLTPGVFYASEEAGTAMAEIAFYRLLFFAESPDLPWPANAVEMTAFQVTIETLHALDLTLPPLSESAVLWENPTEYDASQALAEAAREADVNVVRYRSVRDPQRGCNVAILAVRAFASSKPTAFETWRMRLSAFGVQVIHTFTGSTFAFEREAFTHDPRLGGFRWER